VVEADLVAEAIRRLVEERWSAGWQDKATELLKELDAAVSEPTRRQRKWPKGPNPLSNRLRRAAPSLRRVGITVTQKKSGDRKIYLCKTLLVPPAPPDRQYTQ